jgi:hypothetical protein
MATKVKDDTGWEVLEGELDAWAEVGRTATLWWRDDDAAAPTAALGRLLALATSAQVPLALAVIPAKLGPGVDGLVGEAPSVRVVQHGYAHINHGANHEAKEKGHGAWELGFERGLAPVLGELAAGRDILEATFPGRVAPVLVPPWNRIDERLTAGMQSIGYRGLSTFGARPSPSPVPGLIQINAHCDPIKWKRGRCFAGISACLDALTGHLRANRQVPADAVEPTGLLTHHLDLDEEAWAFTAELIRRVGEHPAARFAAVDRFLPTG